MSPFHQQRAVFLQSILFRNSISTQDSNFLEVYRLHIASEIKPRTSAGRKPTNLLPRRTTNLTEKINKHLRVSSQSVPAPTLTLWRYSTSPTPTSYTSRSNICISTRSLAPRWSLRVTSEWQHSAMICELKLTSTETSESWHQCQKWIRWSWWASPPTSWTHARLYFKQKERRSKRKNAASKLHGAQIQIR